MTAPFCLPSRSLPAIIAAAVDATACTHCWSPAGTTCPPIPGIPEPAAHVARITTAYQGGHITGNEFRVALHAAGVFTVSMFIGAQDRPVAA